MGPMAMFGGQVGFEHQNVGFLPVSGAKILYFGRDGGVKVRRKGQNSGENFFKKFCYFFVTIGTWGAGDQAERREQAPALRVLLGVRG